MKSQYELPFLSLLLLSMMTLITGFTCPPTIYFKFITKCDKCYYRVRQVWLQSATGITKCDNFITKCESTTWSTKFAKVCWLYQAVLSCQLQALRSSNLQPCHQRGGSSKFSRTSLFLFLLCLFVSLFWWGGGGGKGGWMTIRKHTIQFFFKIS